MEENKELSALAAYQMGGAARFFLNPKNSDDIFHALEFSQKKGVPLFILGSGTNLLISDKGFDGLVLGLGPQLKDSAKDLHLVSENASEVLLKIPAHFSKAQLLDIALRNAWGGLEFSAGIPGTLGGAVFMNAGTKWGSYGEVISEVEFVSLSKGIFTLKTDEIGFKYRGLGEGLLDGKTVVSSVTLKLKKNTKDSFVKVDEIYSYRGLRQPLELPNCGSVFKNPVNSEKGAGRLIEAAGLKGLSVGGAEVSLKHANFILNTGNAKALDVYQLIQKIQEVIFSKFQVHLEPEVIFVGEFN